MVEEIVTKIVLSIFGIIASNLGVWLTYWVNNKIKNEKAKKFLTDAIGIVSDGVDYVYQTYVEGLKGTTLWDEAAMKEANNKALEYVKTHLSQQVKDYITETKGDLETWIKEQIEIAIKKSKEA